jgi:hypothetical protein
MRAFSEKRTEQSSSSRTSIGRSVISIVVCPVQICYYNCTNKMKPKPVSCESETRE